MSPRKAGKRIGKIIIAPIIILLVTVKILKSLKIPPSPTDLYIETVIISHIKDNGPLKI